MNIIVEQLNRFTLYGIELILRFRYLVVVITVALMAVLGFQAKDLVIESSYKYFYAKENAQLLAFNHLEATFSKMDSTIIAIQPENELISSPRILQLTRRITEALWDMPHTVRVDSITNYQYTRAEGDDLFVGDLLGSPKLLTEQAAQKIIDIAASKPELAVRLISVENNALAIVARAQIEPGDNQALEEATLYVFSLKEEILKEYPDVNIAVTGLVPRGYHFYKTPINDVSLLVPLMLVLLIIIIWLLTRSIAAPLITIVLVSLSCAAAMGAGALFGIPMTTISSSAPIIILAIAVADSIHILISFLMLQNQGLDRESAITQSMVLNAQPVLLTTATTAIGFLSLNFSVSPPYQDLGNFAALGAFFAWFLSMTFLPAMLAIIPIKPSSVIDKQSKLLGNTTQFILKARYPLFFTVIAVSVSTLLLLPRLEFNDDFVGYFDKRIDSKKDLLFVMDNLTGPYEVNLMLTAPQANGIYDPDYLHQIEEFSYWLEQQPEVTHVHSVVNMFKNINRSMHGDDENYYRIAESNTLNAQYLLLYEMSLPYGLDINDQINLDKSATRIDISTIALKTRAILELNERIEQWMQQHFLPESYTPPTSATTLHSQVGVNNFESMKLGTLVAFIGIAVCIGLSLGSIKLAIISLFLNAAPFIIVFGLFSLSGLYLASWTPFVIPTALGLVVDATVHLLSKYHHAKKTQGLNTNESITYAFTHVGMALWVSTLVLVLGFSTLLLAIVTTLKFLGAGTALIIIVALIVDIMALPALLIYADKIRWPFPKRRDGMSVG